MLFKSTLAACAFAALANAQTIVTSSASSIAPATTVAESMPPSATAAFNSGNVTSDMKFSWCLAQLNTCPQICGGAASLNTCDQTTLTFGCTCPNGTVPDSSAYMQTIPYFVCQQTYIQCVAAAPNDAEAQSVCRANQKCGTRNATAEAIAATGSVTSTTASATGSRTGSASASGASATSSSSDASLTTYTTGAFAALLMVAFKFLL